ncbi:hypothetical protein ABZP36_011052 [Zizania latifolia]
MALLILVARGLAPQPLPLHLSIRPMQTLMQTFSQIASSVPQADGAHGADASVYPTNHASLNGTAGHMADYQSTVTTENGAATNEMSELVPEQSYEDAVLSAEEVRLWNAVTANCVDFNAWIALIDETERIAESNILKIRKVKITP